MTAHTFHVNTLTVDYSGDHPKGSLANGVTVKVSGTMLNAAGALVATRVDVLQGFRGDGERTGGDRGPYHDIHVEFGFRNQRTACDDGCKHSIHARWSDSRVNVPVDVEGTFDASGVLVATSVQATPDDASLVRGLVENVNAASNTLTVLA